MNGSRTPVRDLLVDVEPIFGNLAGLGHGIDLLDELEDRRALRPLVKLGSGHETEDVAHRGVPGLEPALAAASSLAPSSGGPACIPGWFVPNSIGT